LNLLFATDVADIERAKGLTPEASWGTLPDDNYILPLTFFLLPILGFVDPHRWATPLKKGRHGSDARTVFRNHTLHFVKRSQTSFTKLNTRMKIFLKIKIVIVK